MVLTLTLDGSASERTRSACRLHLRVLQAQGRLMASEDINTWQAG